MSSAPRVIIDLDYVEPQKFKDKPNDDELRFGQDFTDRMLLREFRQGAWLKGKIIPYQNFSLPPASLVFHYGQEIFEGLKAFRQINNQIIIFRPDENAKRFNASAERMVMPNLEDGYFLESTRKLVEIEKDWVPRKRGTSLYIRPTMIATEPTLAVHPSSEYYFFTILAPSGPYFAEGFAPTKIKIEDYYARAAVGGTGAAKTGGSYAASLYASHRAQEEGYSQVLWLDAVEKKYVEEVGSMNIAFVMDDIVYTSPLTGTILPGITRKSVIQLCEDMGIRLREEALSVQAIIEGVKSGNLTEIFGIGTAASIAPVGEMKYKNEVLIINKGEVGPITRQLYNQLIGIQYGEVEDKHGWIFPVCEG